MSCTMCEEKKTIEVDCAGNPSQAGIDETFDDWGSLNYTLARKVFDMR